MRSEKTCVLLHGWGLSNTVWKDCEALLGKNMSVCAPSLYDVAQGSEDDSFKSMASFIKQSIKSEAVIVAWSIGGLVATHLALQSDQIKGIVFIASAPCFVNKKNWTNVIDQAGIIDLQNKLNKNCNRALKYFAGLVAQGDISPKETIKTIQRHLVEETHGSILSSWLQQMQEVDQRSLLSELNIPMLFVSGNNDSLIKSKINKELKEINPSITSEIVKDCGHTPFISKQKETMQLINKFINAKLP